MPFLPVLLGRETYAHSGAAAFTSHGDKAIHGRIFQISDAVRDAVREFVARYNAEWPIEKNGYLSPLVARAAQVDRNLRCAA